MALPKRYVFVALGAVGAVGFMYLRNKMGADPAERDQTPGSKSTRPSPKSPSSAPPTSSDGAKPAGDDLPGGQRELREFLAGESWYDEMGWHSVWDRAGIDGPEEWLRTEGVTMLRAEREKLVEHPALLAGCRRRWIVVCRYAGIDVADAAQLWNETDQA